MIDSSTKIHDLFTQMILIKRAEPVVLMRYVSEVSDVVRGSPSDLTLAMSVLEPAPGLEELGALVVNAAILFKVSRLDCVDSWLV